MTNDAMRLTRGSSRRIGLVTANLPKRPSLLRLFFDGSEFVDAQHVMDGHAAANTRTWERAYQIAQYTDNILTVASFAGGGVTAAARGGTRALACYVGSIAVGVVSSQVIDHTITAFDIDPQTITHIQHAQSVIGLITRTKNRPATQANAGASGSGRTYQTYTKSNPATGQVYSGRTSGTGTPEQNVARRDRNHQMNKEGYGPAQLDQSSTNAYAIRGREQQLMDAHGGAQSQGGTSGNKIRGISPANPNRERYLNAANENF